MRRSLLALALLCATAFTPTRARAEPVTAILGVISSAIASVGAAVGGFLTGLGISAGLSATLVKFGGQLLLSAGLSAIARRLAPRPQITSPSERMVNFAQPLAAMEWVFGQARKGGPYAVSSFQQDRRHYGVILAAHEIAGVDQWYIDNQPVEVSDGTGSFSEVGVVTTAPFAGHISLRPYLGTPGQVADAIMVSAIPEWTSAHDMAGLAYVACYAKRVGDGDFAEVYGNSAPTGPVVTPVISGALVYDPRTDTTGYSNNAALVVAWMTENRLGPGTVDWAEVAEEADASDVLVTNRLGGTQRKWTLNGVFSDADDFATILEQVILATDGMTYERPDGTVGFRVGRYIAPTITLTDDDFYTLTLAENDFGQDPPTEYIAQYVEPTRDYLEAPSATLIVDEDARSNRATVPLLYVNNHNQAWRALVRIARSGRARYTLTGTVGIIALELLRERFVSIDVLGKTFVAEIGSIAATDDDTIFEIELTSVLPEDFDSDTVPELEPPARDDVSSDNTVPPPEGFAGVAVDGPGIEWSWNPTTTTGGSLSETIAAGVLRQQLRMRVVGEATWPAAIEIADGSSSVTVTGLIDGESYEAELRNLTSARRPSVWVPSGTVVAVANSTPPGPVTALSAVASGSAIDVGWRTPNDPLHTATRIYRATGASAVFGDAALLTTIYGPPNTLQSYADTGLSPGTYRYWAKSANASGVESALTGPVADTIV